MSTLTIHMNNSQNASVAGAKPNKPQNAKLYTALVTAPNGTANTTQYILEVIGSTAKELFLDQFGNLYIVVQVKETDKHIKVNSEEFIKWVSMTMNILGKIVPNQSSIRQAGHTLSGYAEYDKSLASRKYLSVRVAKTEDGAIYYDLKDKVVKIIATGWNVTTNPPILFRNFNMQSTQVDPAPVGVNDQRYISNFVDSLNLKDDASKLLMKVYLATSFIPDFAHPIIQISGPKGSAKSTLFARLKDIIDPSVIRTLPPITKMEQFIQIVSHNWAAYFDNMSSLDVESSDMFCRACSGAGYVKRELYSDDNDIGYVFKHLIGINGVVNIASRADLVDRILSIELDAISPDKRLTDAAIWQKHNAEKPMLLGECFTVVSQALALEPTLKEQIPTSTRMADFAYWGYLVAEAMGIGGMNFFNTYRSLVNTQDADVIDNNLLASVFEHYVTNYPIIINEITASDLLVALNKEAENLCPDYKHNRRWPDSPQWLWRRLSEYLTNFQQKGIVVRQERQSKSRKIIIDKTIYDNNLTIANQIELINANNPIPLEYDEPFNEAEMEFEQGFKDLVDPLLVGHDDMTTFLAFNK